MVSEWVATGKQTIRGTTCGAKRQVSKRGSVCSVFELDNRQPAGFRLVCLCLSPARTRSFSGIGLNHEKMDHFPG